MAEYVEQVLQEMIPEFEELERLGLLSAKEVKKLIVKRRNFEYKMCKQKKEMQDFFAYVIYDTHLLDLLSIRRKKFLLKRKYQQIEISIIHRVLKRLRMMSHLWPAHPTVWKFRLTFAKSRKFLEEVSTIYAEQVKFHGMDENLWVSWAQWEVKGRKNFDKARNILLSRAPLYHNKSILITKEYFRLELQYLNYLKKKNIKTGGGGLDEIIAENREKVLQCAVPKAIFEHSLKEFNSPEICLHLYWIAHEFSFALKLRDLIFSKMVEMFSNSVEIYKLKAKLLMDGYIFDEIKKEGNKETEYVKKREESDNEQDEKEIEEENEDGVEEEENEMEVDEEESEKEVEDEENEIEVNEEESEKEVEDEESENEVEDEENEIEVNEEEESKKEVEDEENEIEFDEEDESEKEVEDEEESEKEVEDEESENEVEDEENEIEVNEEEESKKEVEDEENEIEFDEEDESEKEVEDEENEIEVNEEESEKEVEDEESENEVEDEENEIEVNEEEEESKKEVEDEESENEVEDKESEIEFDEEDESEKEVEDDENEIEGKEEESEKEGEDESENKVEDEENEIEVENEEENEKKFEDEENVKEVENEEVKEENEASSESGEKVDKNTSINSEKIVTEASENCSSIIKVDLSPKEKLNELFFLYDNALSSLGPSVLETLIEDLFSILGQVWGSDEFRSVVAKKILQIFSSNSSSLSAKQFLIWFTHASEQNGSLKEKKYILKLAKEKYPDNQQIELAWLPFMGSMNQKSKLQFIETLSGTVGAEICIQIINKTKSNLQSSLIERACLHPDTPLTTTMRVKLLDSFTELKDCRKHYEKYCSVPPFCIRLHTSMIKKELQVSPSSVSDLNVRRVFDTAVDQFGQTQYGLWLCYIEFERKFGLSKHVSRLQRETEQQLNAKFLHKFIDGKFYLQSLQNKKITKENDSVLVDCPELAEDENAFEFWRRSSLPKLFDNDVTVSYTAEQNRMKYFSSLAQIDKNMKESEKKKIPKEVNVNEALEEILSLIIGEKVCLKSKKVNLNEIGLDKDISTFLNRVNNKGEKSTISEVTTTSILSNETKKILESSEILKPEFLQQKQLAPYYLNRNSAKRYRRKERAKDVGSEWFNMKAPEITEEVERDLQMLKMRSVLNPQVHYKRNDMKVLPKYFQIGKVVDSPVDFYSSRVTKKERKRTLAEEIMKDEQVLRYQKRKCTEIMAVQNTKRLKRRKNNEEIKQNKKQEVKEKKSKKQSRHDERNFAGRSEKNLKAKLMKFL